MVQKTERDPGLATPPNRARILGIDFFAGSIGEACERAAQGGLVTAPSGPGLGYDLTREPAYQHALETSDLVLTDSAFMVWLWWLRAGRRLPRISGFAFLGEWLRRNAPREAGRVLWVMPSEEEAERTMGWLRGRGFEVTDADIYVAPYYEAGPVSDPDLLSRLTAGRPEAVYLGIGGGVQERLGYFLRENLPYRPTILCLGAALAFMTGGQVNIPPWVDRAGLGWFWRIASRPEVYSVRYLRATRLAWLIFRYRGAAPRSRPADKN
jgi:N-acetylglucosaminyldiphosphoundecaprenol N-acetyl-beta-D-mannosaminyltransferase